MNMCQAITNAIDVQMMRDESTIVFGEDVKFGGVFRCTVSLYFSKALDRTKWYECRNKYIFDRRTIRTRSIQLDSQSDASFLGWPYGKIWRRPRFQHSTLWTGKISRCWNHFYSISRVLLVLVLGAHWLALAQLLKFNLLIISSQHSIR